MLRVDEKFEAAISDTDILIDLFKSGTFQILDLLFHKIYIPELIFEKELIKVVKQHNDISLVALITILKDKNSLLRSSMKQILIL